MTSEQAFQAHKNASSASVSRYGGTTWAAGSGSVDLEIEAEDEPPGAARLNPGDTTQSHMEDNTIVTSATNQPVDHATIVLSHANDQSAADTTTTTTTDARVHGSNDAPTSAPTQTTTDPDEDSLPDISIFIRPDATGYVPVDGSRVSSDLLTGLDPTAADRVGVSVSWVNPKLRACTSTTGSGMFAIQPISKGEHLIGKIVTAEEALAVMDTDDKHYLLQIGDGFYQTPLSQYREPADYTNHSCEPTAGFGKGSPICLSAMCDIPIGGQVLFDYGMCETDPRLWEPMECLCGTPSCRKWITANDWYLYPELWDRYAGYWSPHVQRQIDAYRADLEKKKQSQTGADIIPAADIMQSTSAHSLTLPSLEVMDSPQFTPMQVSSTSPSSSGSSSPISRASTPVSSPPSSPHNTSSSPAPDMLLPSARLSQAKAKAKAKLAKQVDIIKVNKKKSSTTGIHFETTSSSSSSSGDESDVEAEAAEDQNTKEESNTTTPTGVIKQEYIETISTPFYIQWMDRMLATIGLQRIKA